MLSLVSKLRPSSIKKTTLRHLQERQNDINLAADFAAKVKKAKSFWDRKKQLKAGLPAFEDILNVLLKIAPAHGSCVYCERNEATDIEHIFPKSAYPELAFVWKNYLPACSNCNSNYKRNRFAVFSPRGSNQIVRFAFNKNNSVSPPNKDAAFINPRTENPMDFLELIFVADEYIFLPQHDLAKNGRKWLKADITIEIIGLNRNGLPEARFAAAQNFQNQLRRFLIISRAASFAELKSAIAANFPVVDETRHFEQEKSRVLAAVESFIRTKIFHPTVFKEMVRQKDKHSDFLTLFNDLPEGVQNW